MDKFCGSQVWDSNATWYSSNPTFTTCFEKTFLVWTPVIFLCLFSPLEFWYIAHSLCRDIPRRWLYYSKLSLTLSLLLLCLLDEFFSVGQLTSGANVYPVEFVNPLLRIFSYELVLILVIFNRSYGISRSGVLFWFWCISAITGIVQLRSDLIDLVLKNSIAVLLARITFFTILVAQLVLTFFREPLPRRISYPISEKLCPINFVSYPSMLSFSWLTGLIIKGNKKPLERRDLWDCTYELSSQNVTSVFDKYFVPTPFLSTKHGTLRRDSSIDESVLALSGSGCSSSLYVLNTEGENFRKKKSIVPAIWKSFYPSFIFAVLLNLSQVLLSFVNPQILKQLLTFVNTKGTELHEKTEWKAFFFSGTMFVVAMCQTMLSSQYFIKIFTLEIKVKIALNSAIYRKALLLSNSAKKERTIGKIVNLMAVDVNKCADALSFINLLWNIPLRISLATFWLYKELGYSILACLLVLLTLFPIQIYGTVLNKRFQTKEMKFKDERIKLMTEIFTGFKALRLYAWEPYFEKKVLKIRHLEVKYLKMIAYTIALMSFFWLCTPYLMALASFTCYVLVDSDHVLTAEIAFVSLALFNMLQIPLALFPLVVGNLVQAYVSLQRINDYLNSEELNEADITHYTNEDHVIIFKNATFSYGDELILKNINLEIPQGSLVAVVGTVGSGKSSLISALLGDVPKLRGSVNIKGTVAYVPQQAWIQNGTVRKNILFGKPYNKDLYDTVISACALEQDFRQLPAGDLTEITAKGINLSGGQKQRISIARAAYSDADLYLMDDPLSAMDSQVGKWVFDKILGPQGLLSEKTRFVVTQSVNLLHNFSRIIMLKNGVISEDGTFNELLSLRGSFSFFMLQYLTTPSEIITDSYGRVGSVSSTSARYGPASNPDVIKKSETSMSNSSSRSVVDDSGARHQTNQTADITLRKSKKGLNIIPSEFAGSFIRKSESTGSAYLIKTPSVLDERSEPIISLTPDKVIEEELAETGHVKFCVYSEYIKSMGPSLVAGILILNTMYQIFQCSGNIWLSEYTNQSLSSKVFLIGYAFLGVGQIICVGTATLLVNLGALFAAKNLHNAMLYNVMRLPMMFFNVTPYGRILNRFSKDVDALDTILPTSLQGVISISFMVAGILLVIAIFLPLFILFVIPFIVVYCFIQRYYVSISRQLKSLESINRSPIYSHFEETLSGTTSIRAYGAQKRFIEEYHNIIGKNTICSYPVILCDRWLQVRVETVGNLIVFVTTFCTAFYHHLMSSGDIGLIIIYAMLITVNLNMLVRNATMVETNIVGAERIKEYATLTQEAPWKILPNLVSEFWPENGEVRFENYFFRYREGLDYALKGISFTVKGGEKVGIVGRTGAGKSSLSMALFRVVEASSGAIFVDGVDISTIGLHTLRSRLTIIPQDPVLFSGSLRRNLDPGHQYKDKKLQHALETAHLHGLASHLDLSLMEGGENFSIGQCQLLCLARALLRKSKILVLDEATANIDYQTEEFLQETIRYQFADCTILTIAHRLRTIMDSDRVLVLSNGKVAEFDSPEILLKNKSSIFYALAKDADIVV